MSTSKCNAKDPSRCRYHSKFLYEGYVDALRQVEPQLSKARSMEEYDRLSKFIAKKRLGADANEYGFKKLNKEFQKALKGKDIQKQAELAARIKAASEERLKDGIKGEWDDLYNDDYAYGTKVLEKAETQDVVKVPYGFSGSQHVLTLWGRIRNEGYEVKTVTLHGHKSEEVDTKLTQKVVSELRENETKIRNGEYSRVYEDVLGRNKVLLDGITFTKNGRDITVQAMTTEEEEDAYTEHR